ncbi:hypothetical protein L3X38_036545 [Prunus dulcis]|uniref:Uncharacterized protein n=1 Tax=Prunus dulcis TaxID=3755 RepID=A0AAD4YQG0_PRUDU|nr:hypothetical protein L3X38_036545 [Prunus dulcis]
MLNTKPTVSLKEANHKTVCFVYKGTETTQTSSSLPGTHSASSATQKNLIKGGSATLSLPKLWCVRSLLRGTEPSQTQRQAGTFIEHLVCTQGVTPQLSKGSSMESTTIFQAFQGVVVPMCVRLCPPQYNSIKENHLCTHDSLYSGNNVS